MIYEKKINDIAKQLKGSIMAIGVESKKVIDTLENNPDIVECGLLDCFDTMPIDGKKQRNKTVPLKKLRKKVGKKRLDTILCHISSIDGYWRYFIRDSIYMTKDEIIYYGKKEELSLEKEEFQKRYQRYKNVKITFHEDREGIFIKVKVNGAKRHIVLDKFYFIRDSLHQGVQLLGDYLVQ